MQRLSFLLYRRVRNNSQVISISTQYSVSTQYCAYPLRDGQTELAWVATVTHPSTNPARRRTTVLMICAATLPISQTVIIRQEWNAEVVYYLGLKPRTSTSKCSLLRATAYSAYTLYAIVVHLSVRLSFCPSVTRVDQSKTVEVRMMQFSPYSSPAL